MSLEIAPISEELRQNAATGITSKSTYISLFFGLFDQSFAHRLWERLLIKIQDAPDQHSDVEARIFLR
jgi:hypothetical protein